MTLPNDAAARLFVLTLTAVGCVAGGWLVFTQGCAAVPVQDEWDVLGQAVDGTPLPAWAFAHHNEHRYPLAKLLWLGTLRASGYDFRAPMFVSLGLLTAAAVLLQWAARRMRGRTHPLDALFPILLLHWGHAFNLLMGYQLGFAIVAYAAAGWVWCGVNWHTSGRPYWAWGSAAYALLLVPCGGFGLVFTPGVVGWLAYLAVVAGRERRWVFVFAFLFLGVSVIAYSGWVVITLPPTHTSGYEPFRQPGEFLGAVGAYLGGALGDWGVEIPEPVRLIADLLVVGVYVVAAALATVWVVRAKYGLRTVGVCVLLALASVFGCALAAARARGVGVAGGRFTTPSVVGLAVAVFTLTFVVRTRPFSSALCAVGVLAVAVGLAWLNFNPALRHAYYLRSTAGELKADLLAGEPPTVLAGRYGGTFSVLVGDRLAIRLVQFKRAGIGVFPRMIADPPYASVPVVGISLPYTMGSPDSNTPPDSPAATVRLPVPPAGAFAVRWKTTTVRSSGWQQLVCRWNDPITGEPCSSVAHPSWTESAVDLVFTFAGRPTDLRVETASAVGLLRVDAMEWLVVPPTAPP